jgi:hypothetical protein
MALINPTIGRKVWFYPQKEDLDEGMKQIDPNLCEPQPFDATIVYVHGSSLVNLHVLDHLGNAWKFENVILLEGLRPYEFPVRCASWMPYQLDQARRNVPKPVEPAAWNTAQGKHFG